MSETANRVVKNTGYLYVNLGLSMFVSLYSTRLILNALGSSDFGIFCIIGGAIGMLGFLSSAMAQTTQRFINYAEGAKQTERKKKIFTVSLLLHFILSLIMVVFFELAGLIFFNGLLNIPSDRVSSAQWIYQFMIFSTALTIQSVPYSAIINAHENMLYYSLLGICQTILKLMIAFIVVYSFTDKLILYGLLMTILSFLVLVIQRIYCHKKYEECIFNLRLYYDKNLMKEMTSYAGWGLLGSSSSMFSQYGMGIVLNMFGGTVLNAAQGIANQVSGQLMVFSRTMLQAVNPVIGKSAGEGNKDKIVRISFMSSKMSFIILGLFAFPFFIEAPYIMKIWLKNVPEWAIVFFRFEIIRNILQQTLITIDSAIQSEGKIKYYNIFRSITFFLPLPITVIFLMLGFSPYWYYIVWIFFWNFLGGGIILYFGHLNCGFKYKPFFYDIFLPELFISIIVLGLGFIIAYYFTESFFRILIVLISVSLLYAILIWIFLLKDGEKIIVSNVILTIKNKLIK